MLAGSLQGLRIIAEYKFDSVITQMQKYGPSRLFDTVTWYNTDRANSTWISSMDPVTLEQRGIEPCGRTVFTSSKKFKRELNKLAYDRATKYSIAELDTTSQDWLGAEASAALDAASRKIDEVILKSLQDNVNIKVDTGGSILRTATEDGVKVIDATVGADGFTKAMLEQVIAALKNKSAMIGDPSNPITLVLSPAAEMQLRESFGNTLYTFNYRDEFVGTGSGNIWGLRVEVLPESRFPQIDASNFYMAAYSKRAVGLTTVALNKIRWGNNESPMFGDYSSTDIFGVPYIDQVITEYNDIAFLFQFLAGAVRLDPNQIVLIKQKAV